MRTPSSEGSERKGVKSYYSHTEDTITKQPDKTALPLDSRAIGT